MFIDKKDLFVLDYNVIQQYDTYFDFVKRRISVDFADNIAVLSNITKILTSKDFIAELRILYPRGILYDNIVWDFNDYDWVLSCLHEDELRYNRIKELEGK